MNTLTEIKGDLFTSSDSLAHCVSQDLNMGAGIALNFAYRYGGQSILRQQNKVPSQVAFLQQGDRFIYYLITKEKYWHKPTYETLRLCLRELFRLCSEHNVHKLSLPRIGCGLDRLEWNQVKRIILEEMNIGTRNLEVKVYSL